MMAQAFAPGVAPNHPGMGAHAHPMGAMQAGAGHPMGGPAGPGMMQAIHPGVSAPQVTQGPIVTGMPPGPATPAPGGPMQNPMAMAHLGPQPHMFPQQANPQMFGGGGMPMTQQMLLQQRIRLQQQQQQQQQQQHQGGGMPMGMPVSMPPYSQAHLAQMKMNGMNMNPQTQMQMQAHNAQSMVVAQHQAQFIQQAQARQQAAAMAAQNQRQVSQAHNMQISRSQEQPITQAPQPHPTPAPQNQPPPSQHAPQTQPPTTQPAKVVAPPPPPTTQPPSQSTPQVKQADEEGDAPVKPQESNNNNNNNNNSSSSSNNNANNNAIAMQAIPKEQIFPNQKENAILQLILFQNSLANPLNPRELSCWDAIVRKFFSPFGTLKHQFVRPEAVQEDKTFLLQYPSLARYLHAHFLSGIKQILLQSYEHSNVSGQTPEILVTCSHASLTYVFNNDVRVSTEGSLIACFDETNKITKLEILAKDWKEYLPRSVLIPTSPDQTKDGKTKAAKKNQAQIGSNQVPHLVPVKTVGVYGVPKKILGWLEIVEVMNLMTPLIDYCNSHNGIGPRDGMNRVFQENPQNFAANANQAVRLQNQMARQINGQIAFPPVMAMNGPNQFASPAMAHLGLPQAQGSPHHPGSVHTPSPAQNPAGGVPMVPQMSAQGSLSGSQGASTNTSPNVSNKRRRASQIKLEEENASQGGDNANKVKASPRITKRQKGA